MRIELRPITAIGILFAVLVLISGSSIVASEFIADVDSDREVETVELADGTEIWPYTSRGPTYDERTLSLNLIIYGDPMATEFMLRHSTVGEWVEIDEERQDIAPAEEFDIDTNRTSVAWGGADGAVRYTNVQSSNTNGNAIWMTESYQLADGEYLGARHHIRAYVDPINENWTAFQAHDEHWDWFHLRHTVHSIESSQSYVEAEFIDHWMVDDLRRERFGNDASSDADGWVTVIDLDRETTSILMGALFLASIEFGRVTNNIRTFREQDEFRMAVYGLGVILSIIALYMGIRFGAIWIERFDPTLNPKLIVATFYPLLVIGLPVVTYLSARPLDRIPAFTAGTLGFVLAMFMDYTYLGVAALPIDTFVHRAALAVALGFIAAGASRTARHPEATFGLVRTGVLIWVLAVIIPILQFL